MKSVTNTTAFNRLLTQMRADGIILTMQEPDTATSPAPPAPPDPPAATVFTQADLDRIVGERLKAQKTQFEAALGSPVDAAAKLIKDAEVARRAALDDVARQQLEAVEATAAAAIATAQAAKAAHETNVVRGLLVNGVPADKVDLVARLIVCEVGADAVALTSAIVAAKTALPELFTGVPAAPAPGGAGLKPGVPPVNANPGTDARSLGAARAAAIDVAPSYDFMKPA